MNEALVVYRQLARVARNKFKRDETTLKSAYGLMHQTFMENRDQRDPEALKALFAEAREAAEFLKHNVVQGVQNERGNFVISDLPEDLDGTGLQEPKAAISQEKAR